VKALQPMFHVPPEIEGSWWEEGELRRAEGAVLTESSARRVVRPARSTPVRSHELPGSSNLAPKPSGLCVCKRRTALARRAACCKATGWLEILVAKDLTQTWLSQCGIDRGALPRASLRNGRRTRV